jgi:uroporphyrinogen decarboxylase
MDGLLADHILGKTLLYNKGWEELEALWAGERRHLVDDYITALVELPRTLEWDYVRVPAAPPARDYPKPWMTGPYSWIDDQGRENVFNPAAGSLVVQRHRNSMTFKDLPDPEESSPVDDSELEIVSRIVRALGRTHFIIGRSPVDGTFPWDQTVGMEEFLVRMLQDPVFVSRAVQAYVNRSIVYMDKMIDAGVDAIMTTDDYCDNRGPIMGKNLFQKFILPGIRRQADYLHSRGVYFIKHTDGYMWDILDELVHAGIDGWHGIQRNIGMDMQELKKRFGNRICLFGGVNCETLIEGTPSQVRAEVQSAIHLSARGGGLVLTTSNVIAPGSRLENYLELRKAVRDYGKYPIPSAR